MPKSTDSFRPRARLLLLLGDQLIRDPAVAVFELVKNAYDADSPYVSVIMSGVDGKSGSIRISDAGCGMDLDVVRHAWLEPGTDRKLDLRARGERTKVFNRLPLGEKGVGRFAVHKLGNNLRMVTRAKDCSEIVVQIDWSTFTSDTLLKDIPISITQRAPKVFPGDKTGTRIVITQLRNVWTRGMMRDLARTVNTICSPFDKHGDFKIKLSVPDHPDWLGDILTAEAVLDYALFKASGTISDSSLTYEYEFRPYPQMKRVVERAATKTIQLPGEISRKVLKEQIGTVGLDFYIFDREPKILALGVSDKKGLKEFLDANGGVKIYRDGMRVFYYGERGDDWLNLSGRRVNVPAKRVSNNLIIAGVEISLRASSPRAIPDSDELGGLVEKTNREGFVENEAFETLRAVVAFAITQIEAERSVDKSRIRNAYTTDPKSEPVLGVLSELRTRVQELHLEGDLKSYMDRIEDDFVTIRDRFILSATAGLSLSVVIHEVEKGLKELLRAIEAEKVSTKILELARHVSSLIEGFAELVRRSDRRKEKASSLVRAATMNTELRLRFHKISLKQDFSSGDFSIKCSRRLIVSTIMNILDNSIWWLDNKFGDSEGKRIHIRIDPDYVDGRPAIIIGDNGGGFSDSPEYLVEPFLSRKPNGIGLGLHIADQVMRAHDGTLDFPDTKEASLPDELTGAVIALVFK